MACGACVAILAFKLVQCFCTNYSLAILNIVSTMSSTLGQLHVAILWYILKRLGYAMPCMYRTICAIVRKDTRSRWWHVLAYPSCSLFFHNSCCVSFSSPVHLPWLNSWSSERVCRPFWWWSLTRHSHSRRVPIRKSHSLLRFCEHYSSIQYNIIVVTKIFKSSCTMT